jgi:hypothetical protein
MSFNFIIPQFRIENSYIIDLEIEDKPSVISIDIDKIINSYLRNKDIKLVDCTLNSIYEEAIEDLKLKIKIKLENSEIEFSKKYGESKISEENVNLCIKFMIDSFDKLIKSEIDYPTFKRIKLQTESAKKYLEYCLAEKDLT